MMKTAIQSSVLTVPDRFSPPGLGDGADSLERAIAATHRPRDAPDRLGRDQKAAIIVRLLMSADGALSLGGLAPENTAQLVRAMAGLSHVDEATTLAVIDEFLAEFGRPGLYFRPGIEAALETLADSLEPEVRELFADKIAPAKPSDPWATIAELDPKILAEILASQTPQVAAIVLAKLKPGFAAEVLAFLESGVAHTVALATATTGHVKAHTIAEIGNAIVSLAAKGGQQGALPGDATERIGAILNFTSGVARKDLLGSLERADPNMADRIRRIMFTFGDIPDRIEVKDVPKLVRAVDNDILIAALAGGQTCEKETVDFIFANLSKRLSEQLADEVGEVGEVKQKEADQAMNALLQGIRDLEESGELVLITPEE